ncbi:MAG: hypothetical protein B0D92_01575 [Spirochaeta sp. LUC14_002_19_P3]|nr:MAG: hypothetical protein B0D92_01575 [Spirochaeta sp. LUC14_002_19_P3]
MVNSQKHRVLGLRAINSDAYVLRFERGNLDFEPGQYIHIGTLPGTEKREYTVYSSPREDYLEVLIRSAPSGNISQRLCQLKAGEEVSIEGPFGLFQLDSTALDSPLFFLGIGTGITPFHCFVQSYPNLNYKLIHGVCTVSECYEYEKYDKNRLLSCISREEGGSCHDGVSDWLRNNPIPHNAMVYLCGSSAMIYDVYEILGEQKFDTDRILVEVYY